MVSFDETFLRALPYPAIVALDGRVFRRNELALRLFPDLTEGSPLPQPLVPTSGEAAGLVFAGQASWRLSVSSMDPYTLYLLCPAQLGGVSPAMLDGAVCHLHELLSMLTLNVENIRSCLRADTAPTSVAQATQALCRLIRLADHMDLLPREDGGELPFRPVPLDMGGLCREVCRTAGDLLTHIRVSIEYIPPQYPALVKGDHTLLQKLLAELIGNAARAAGADSQLTLSLEKQGSQAVLTLSGPELDQTQRSLADILMGQRSPDEVPAAGEGAGLGMLLIRRVVSLHEGTLVMERGDGRVRCILSLPLASRNAHLSLHSPKVYNDTGFCPELVALSELLPWQAFVHSIEN